MFTVDLVTMDLLHNVFTPGYTPNAIHFDLSYKILYSKLYATK